ncbi:carboxypeptidase-like regulatory domain-containing protein, partial [Patescibacteria group bacterium]|nr:carboxypeptidase-like regulatory domain-containing protein [Patescibacteria group bacterium]
TGGASKITLTPSVAATPWYISAPVGTSATNVIVSYSQSTNHITPVTCTDSGNNVNWDFDVTPPVLSFTDDVEAGPVASDTITGNWGDASVKKWEYDDDGVCSTTSGDYSKTDANSIDQADETNNTKYICLYGEDALGNKDTLASAYDINIDITPPGSVAVSLITATSSSQLTVTAQTAVDSGSGLSETPYQFKRVDGETTDWVSSATLLETGLSPNTQHAYQVRVRDELGNISEYSSILYKYTLANVPSSLSVSADSIVQITATWAANSNPQGTEYYIENTNNSSSSGWVTSLFWTSSGLTCSTSYSFRVKTRNGDGAQTDFIDTVTRATDSCGGASLPSGAYSAPSVPTGGFSVSINNNESSTDRREVTLLLGAGSDTDRMAISNNPEFTNSIQEIYQSTKQWILSEYDGEKTVYIRFFTSYGQSSGTYSDTIYLGAKSIIRQIAEVPAEVVRIITETKLPEKIVDVIGKIGEVPRMIFDLFKPKQATGPILPPIEDVVKKEAPFAMRKQTEIMPVEPVESFVLGPMPEEIISLIQKLPQLGQALKDLGVSRATDVSKLVGVNLNLPGLTEVTGLSAADRGAEYILPEGVLLGQLTDAAKIRIPSDIIFARGASGLIDQNASLAIDQQGNVQQKIEVVSNQSVQLIIKPDKLARAIKGYLLFKKKRPTVFMGIVPEIMTASLFQTNGKGEQTNTEERLVVLEFYYSDPDGDGIWTADVDIPVVDGEYEIVTVIDYQDQRLEPTQMSLIVVVDPEGYIYYQKSDGQIRVEGGKVTLYWLNPETRLYEIWQARKYQQTNPQITDVTGRYSFLVPEGDYYLKVEARGYTTYYSEEFEVVNGVGVHENIELKKNNLLARYLDWKIIVILLMSAGLAYSFYRDRRSKQTISGKKY